MYRTLLPVGVSLALIAAQGRAPSLDMDRLAGAIERIESGGRNLSPYWDVNGMAWGLYGMHMARWIEIGGTQANWGKAGVTIQRRLFRAALAKRAKSFESVARWHNGAGAAHYAYARKLEKEYNR